jgi:pre-mRNA-splicing helicase BRR2
VFDFMEAMNPEENSQYETLVKRLALSQGQLAQAANFTNSKYPDISMEFEVEDEKNLHAGEPSYLNIKIEREVDEDDDLDTTVHAPFFPVKKSENWWLVVGSEATKTLLAIKRVTIGRSLDVRLEFAVPTPGKHDLKLFLMSDSYVGVDQEPGFSVTVSESMDVDDDEDDDDEKDE